MTSPSHVKTISFTALQRARTTIEDFVQSYYPYVGLDPVKDVYRYLDVLVWLEASIYQLDEENELLSRAGQLAPGCRLIAESPIAQVLEEQGLLDARTRDELSQGDAYWEGERRLCAAMLAAGTAAADPASTAADPAATTTAIQPGADTAAVDGHFKPTPGHACGQKPIGFTLKDALAVHRAKSFDYRVLHLVLRQLVARDAAAAARDPMRMLLHGAQPAAAAVQLPWEDLGDSGVGEGGRGLKRGREEEVEEEEQRREGRLVDIMDVRQEEGEESDGGRDQSDLLMSFLRVDELLVDIGDDLTDYEDDVEANSFNLLRAYVFLYGTDAPMQLIKRISQLEKRHAALLARLPPALRAHYWARHNAASRPEGGEEQAASGHGTGMGGMVAQGLGHEGGGQGGREDGAGQEGRAVAEGDDLKEVGGGGRWSFPPTLILDEAAFRAGLASGSGSGSSSSSGSENNGSGSGSDDGSSSSSSGSGCEKSGSGSGWD